MGLGVGSSGSGLRITSPRLSFKVWGAGDFWSCGYDGCALGC